MKAELACPICKTRLEIAGDEGRCPQDGQAYRRVEGVWRLLRPGREAHFAQFIHEYETVRQAEGRGSDDPAYYRALPFQDVSGRMPAMWQERARSFQTLLSGFILHPSSLILDLGAGNGWLSYQLAKRGHGVTAVDLTTNRFDGLGTHVMYDAEFLPVQAEFDHLPFTNRQVDLTIFNASFHYSTDYAAALAEAWRVTDGAVAIMDTPVYHDSTSGRQMVQEREALFQERYGFPSNAVASENFLTYHRLDELAAELGVRWRLFWPVPQWRWTVRRWRARLRRQREPSQFPLIVGTTV